MIRAVLFDMDGVLFDTERTNLNNLVKICDELGFSGCTEEFYKTTLGVPFTESRKLYMAHFGDNYPFETMMERYKAFFRELAAAGKLPRKDGLMECLTGLRARGLKVCLVTSTIRTLVDEYFTRMQDIAACFDGQICGGETPHGKPAPDMYLAAAKLMDCRPEECIGVEDSLNGVKSVHAAGARCVMIPDMLPFGKDFAPYVDDCLTTLHELCPLIDGLNKA